MIHPALSLIPAPPKAPADAPSGSDESIRTALRRVITSKQFAKAHRCSALLNYLVERHLSCSAAVPPPELEVGIAVFGRDPHSYYPTDDPIVRVQAGRLRLRLAAYYADEGAAEPLRISVPLGSYQARISVVEAKPARPAADASPVLMFRPLVCLCGQDRTGCFTSGLSAELEYRLYRDLPSYKLIGPVVPRSADGGQGAFHVLEGTVRQDPSRLRVSLNLRQGDAGAVTWYEQFDSSSDGSIAGQEQMAERCVKALQRHMLG